MHFSITRLFREQRLFRCLRSPHICSHLTDPVKTGAYQEQPLPERATMATVFFGRFLAEDGKVAKRSEA